MAASLIFDIVIASICLIIILRNAARGFIRSLITLMKSVFAIFLAYLLDAPLARGFSNWFFEDISRGWVSDLMLSTEKDGGYALYEIFNGIPDWFAKLTVSVGIEQDTVDKYFIQDNLASKEIVEELSYPFGEALSMLISSIVAFVVLFIVIEIVLIFLGVFLNKLGQLPILRVVNIILGALIGAIISVVVAWLISMAIIFVFDFGFNYYPDVFTSETIEKTIIVDFFSDHNLFVIAKNWFS